MKKSIESHAAYYRPFLRKATTSRVELGPMPKGEAVRMRVGMHTYREQLQAIDPDLAKAFYRAIVRVEPTPKKDEDLGPIYKVVGEPRDIKIAPYFEAAGIFPEEIAPDEEDDLWAGAGITWSKD